MAKKPPYLRAKKCGGRFFATRRADTPVRPGNGLTTLRHLRHHEVPVAGGCRATTEGDAVPTRPTPSALTPRADTPSSGIRPRTAGTGLLAVAVLAAGIALAGPAAAAQDPSKPTATVTRGPSCDPGGIQIQVTGGTAPYDVVLATTRDPDGEDEAQVQPGATVVLQTGPVDWGETVDPRLQYTPLDSTGTAFVDELPDWTMTRPSEQDCAAVEAPAAVPTTSAPASPPPSRTPSPAPEPPAPTPEPEPAPAPAPDEPQGAPSTPTAVVAQGAAGDDGPSSRAVGAGRPITVRATGFQPGEEVTVRLAGSDVLGRGTAGPDGVAEVPVFVPAAAEGPTLLDVVGRTSGVTTGLRLQVAASRIADAAGDRPLSWPALIALVSLFLVGGSVVTVLGRRWGGSPGSA